MDRSPLLRHERILEASICELIFAGSFSFMFTGFVSGTCLYACFFPWPDIDPNEEIILLPKLFYLPLGILFGFFFFEITQEIYINIHIKVNRLINYMKSWRVNHSTDEEEEEEDGEEKEGCPICLEHLERGSIGVVRLHCLHRYHRDCINRWLLVDPCCPTCRVLVTVAKLDL